MSFEAGRSEILGDSVPGSPNVLDFSNKLDLNKLLGSGGSHPIVLRVLEQNSRSHSQRVQPPCYESLLHPDPLLVCRLFSWYVQCTCSHLCSGPQVTPVYIFWQWRIFTMRRRDVFWLYEIFEGGNIWKPLDVLYFQRLYQSWSYLGIKDAVYHFEQKDRIL